MKLETRIEKLERSTPAPASNPFDAWSDEELDTAIYCLQNEKQFPPELQTKRETINWPLCTLTDEELDAKIQRLLKDV